MQRVRVRADLMRDLLNRTRPLRERVRDAELTDNGEPSASPSRRASDPTGPTPARARSFACRRDCSAEVVAAQEDRAQRNRRDRASSSNQAASRHRETLIPMLEVEIRAAEEATLQGRWKTWNSAQRGECVCLSKRARTAA